MWTLLRVTKYRRFSSFPTRLGFWAIHPFKTVGLLRLLRFLECLDKTSWAEVKRWVCCDAIGKCPCCDRNRIHNSWNLNWIETPVNQIVWIARSSVNFGKIKILALVMGSPLYSSYRGWNSEGSLSHWCVTLQVVVVFVVDYRKPRSCRQNCWVRRVSSAACAFRVVHID